MISLVLDPSHDALQNFGLTLDGSGVGLWFCQQFDDYRTCCEEWFRLSGLTPSVNMQCPDIVWLQSVHSEDRTRIRQLMVALRSGKIQQLNARYRVMDAKGQWQRVLTRGQPTQWSEQSKPTHFSGVDIFLSTLGEDPKPRPSSDPKLDDAHTCGTLHLADSIKTLSVALECADQGIWHVDEEAGITTVNTTWQTMRGHSPYADYSLANDKWLQDVHPDDLALVTNRDDIRDEMNTDTIDYTYRHRHTDGTWHWIWVRGKITERDDKGKPLCRMGSDTDITSIKDTQLVFERLSSTLNLAMQAAGMGLWEHVIDANGSFWDDRTCQIFGIGGSARFVHSSEFTKRIHPDDQEALAQDLRLTLKNISPISADYRIVHPELGIRHIKTYADWHNFTNEPSRYIGLVWDVTDAHSRERELADAYDLLDDVIEHMDQGLVMFSGKDLATSQVRLANETFFSILELPRHLQSTDASLHTYLSYLLSNDYLSNYPNLTVDLFLQQLHKQDIAAAQLKTPSGKTVRAAARRMNSDAIILTFSDISDLIRAEEERKALTERLNHNHRMQSIGELTGGIAHDFNNLLAIIAGNTELLGMSIDQDNRQLQAICNAAYRGAELTQNLLAFSSKQALKPAAIDIRNLVENVCGMLERTLGNKIAVRVKMPDIPWTCMADPGQLENALINLAVNARDAMPEGGSLKIEVSNVVIDKKCATTTSSLDAGNYIRIDVSDTGNGMTPAVLEKAIEPFFSTKSVTDGSGLGLSIVFGFVNQSGGSINISSAVNQGSTVSLHLPRCYDKSKTPRTTKPSTRIWPRGEGRCIMLVEDDKEVQQMLVLGLQKLGFQIMSASTARDALDAINHKNQSIDLVISDIMLPGGINGFELGRAIHQIRCDLPIIFMSGYAQSALSETYVDADDIDLLHKPFTINELAKRIGDCLEPATH